MPLAAISIDVDSLWVIAGNIGESAAVEENAIYTDAIPAFLRLLDGLSIKATFFCVGRDLSIAGNRDVLAEVVRQGHEVANHSMTHPKDWTALGPDEIEAEVTAGDAALREAGVGTISGFRASGYYLDDRLVSAVRRAGYTYDSSVMPSFAVPLLMPIGRMLMARSFRGRWSYGRLSWAWAPLRPYRVDGLLELPIACIPVVRVPFHSTFVFAAGFWLFRWGLTAFRRSALPLVYVFHAVDLLDGSADDRLKRYMTTQVPLARRLAAVRAILEQIVGSYRVVTCAQLADDVRRGMSL